MACDNRRVRWVGWLLMLAGCDYVVGLTEHVDAMPGEVVAIDAPFDASGCPGSYATVPGQVHRYRVQSVATTYVQGKLACLDDLARTHLAVINTHLEAEALVVYATTIHPTDLYFWVGAEQSSAATQVTDDWEWVTGLPIDDTAWATGEPNDLDMVEDHQEDHAILQTSDGLLVDTSNGDYYAICECDGIPSR